MESKMALKLNEKGQSLVWFAILLPVIALFAMGIADFMVTNIRVQAAIAAADLAAHAGAQEIVVRPSGKIEMATRASMVAANFFSAQKSQGALTRAHCAILDGRPACQVSASVMSSGLLLPKRPIIVQSIGYLAYGVTRDDQ
jgi:hypothetical protein